MNYCVLNLFIDVFWFKKTIFSHCFAGYPSFKGQVLDGKQLWDLIEGLAGNDLLYYTHLLTGEPLSFFLLLLDQNDSIMDVVE